MPGPELPPKRPDRVPHAPLQPVVRPTDTPPSVDRVVIVPPHSRDTDGSTRRNVKLPGDPQTGPGSDVPSATPPFGVAPRRPAGEPSVTSPRMAADPTDAPGPR